MFEHRKEPLISRAEFVGRIFRNFLVAIVIIIFSLFLGMSGYHFIAHFSWMDSLLNASMILTGMGPVNILTDNASKLFASFYAIFSGVAFLTTIAFVFAPIVHRFMHKFHLDEDE